MGRKNIVVSPSFESVDFVLDPQLVFVLMPFSEKWSGDVYHVIRKVGQSMGLRVMRSDDIFAPNIIINDIWRMIHSAGLIVRISPSAMQTSSMNLGSRIR